MAGRAKTSKKKASPSKSPGAEDFTRKAIYRAVLRDTVQHPLTIFPAAASAVSGLYMGLFGLGPTSAAVTFGAALVGAGVWVYNYFIRGEALAEKHVAKLRQLREQHQHAEIASLESDWKRAGLAEGIQQARELRQVYQKLEVFLKARLAEAGGLANPSDKGLGVQRFMVLAEDTYREGAAILRAALHTYEALKQVDHDKLERELASWRAELEQVRGAGAEPPRIEALERRISSHERRLELFRQRVESIDRLFAESEALESALESTYLEAVDLGSPDAVLGHGQAASALERAVTAARRVEDRLRDLEQPNKEDDIYLTAGDR